MKSVLIHVSGRVQGVFFRVYTRNYVQELQNITGYVKNLYDGRVEIFAEGPESSLEALVHWTRHQGSPYSHVTHIEEKWENITLRNYNNFQITY